MPFTLASAAWDRLGDLLTLGELIALVVAVASAIVVARLSLEVRRRLQEHVDEIRDAFHGALEKHEQARVGQLDRVVRGAVADELRREDLKRAIDDMMRLLIQASQSVIGADKQNQALADRVRAITGELQSPSIVGPVVAEVGQLRQLVQRNHADYGEEIVDRTREIVAAIEKLAARVTALGDELPRLAVRVEAVAAEARTPELVETAPTPTPTPYDLVDEHGLLDIPSPLFAARLAASTTRGWRSVACYNYKGGVGKTTIALNLAHALAAMEYRVLLVDVDPQANLTLLTLGHEAIRGLRGGRQTLIHLLRQRFDGQAHTTLGDWTRPSRWDDTDRVQIVPNVPTHRSVEAHLGIWYGRGHDPRAFWLEALADPHHYDVVLFDCPPSMGMMSQAAIAAADLVIVPVVPAEFVLDGVRSMHDGVRRWWSMLGMGGAVGLLPNRVSGDGDTDLRARLENIHPGGVLATSLPDATGTRIDRVGSPLAIADDIGNRGRLNQLERAFQDQVAALARELVGVLSLAEPRQ